MPSASHRALISTSGHNQCQTPQTWFESYNSLFSPIGCVNYAWCPTRVATLMQKQNSLTFHWLFPDQIQFFTDQNTAVLRFICLLLLRITARKNSTLSRTWQQRNRVNLQPYKTSRRSVSQRRMKSLNRWTEYCSDLYNYETDGDPLVLDCLQIPDEVHHPILREEVEAAVKALKMGKTAGVDNISAELVQGGGEGMIDILTAIYKIWRQENGQPHVITLPKKGARTTEPSALSAILLWSCWRSS